MNMGIHTHTPFVVLLDMPIMQYMRYEQLLVDQLAKTEGNG